MNKIIIRIYRLKWRSSAALLYFTSYIAPLFFLLASSYYTINPPDQSRVYEFGFSFILIVGVLIAPFVETYLFQYLPYAISGNWYKKKIILLSILSGVLFGLVHMGNLSTFAIKFGPGFFYQLWFILFARRYSVTIAFFSIAGVHLLTNLLAFLTAYFTGAV